MKLQFKPRSDYAPSVWDAFCMQSSQAWFRHTTAWIEYTLHMRWDGLSQDCSFFVYDTHRIVAVVPLIIECIDNHRFFSYAGFNTPYPALADTLPQGEKNKIQDAVFSYIHTLASSKSVGCAQFEISPFYRPDLNCAAVQNPLMHYGFNDTSLRTSIINLRENTAKLEKKLHKNHRQSIAAAQKNNFTVEIMDQESFDRTTFERYKELHRKAAGRQTRPDFTWECMQQWIRDGNAVLGLLYCKKNIIAITLVTLYKKYAYYQSACNDYQYPDTKGAGHFLQWKIMQYLKNRGFTFYEMGWIHLPVFSQERYEKKLVSISSFKRAFGGMLYPLFRGEKFYDKSFMFTQYQQRIDSLFTSSNSLSKL